jgi:hypothetical protein
MRSLLLALLLTASQAQAQPVPLTSQQFKLYRDYQAATHDSRVERLSPDKRIPAIARNFHVSEAQLREAIFLGDRYGTGIEKQSEIEVLKELSLTQLKDRVLEVKVDATDGHVVTYVEWENTDPSKIEEEAAIAAMTAAQGAPISSTIAVWAKDSSGRKVFEAKIDAIAASHFQASHMVLFAKTRYIRVFEDVRTN